MLAPYRHHFHLSDALYTLRTVFLPWLVIADLSRDILKSAAERDAADRRTKEMQRIAELWMDDFNSVSAELAALKSKQQPRDPGAAA